ncbi:NADH-quinone oxidoreductase subunit N [Orientia tsutsugamushi]|uniref:NADH-quinone oxidoreductase subunit N n=1 Tax=Orientia tsutsugamushi (strain Boryong) TaxID=357244 RepID=A5CFP1_ORITB|nr:NADH-quinone oxidoreductase subunit N [Orientia tsutsugamushi]CAM81261.1 NADH dehydrogenase I chain N [Orientia tsutsugamushi str. Boryong]
MEMLYGIMPEISLLLSALIFQLIGAYSNNTLTHVIAKMAIGFAAILIAILVFHPNLFNGIYWNNTFIVNQSKIYLKIIILIFYISLTLIYSGYIKVANLKGHSEYIVLMQLGALGGLILVSANDFMVMYLGIEMQGIIGYILTTFNYNNSRSSEAGLKYFILGTVFSAIMLFGISLVYGITQSIRYDIALHALQNPSSDIAALVAILMILVGVLFKLSIAPFHMWTPDIYDGAPLVVVALFSSFPKISVLALLGNLLSELKFASETFFYIKMIIMVLACLSLIVGAFGALLQQSIQRFIAYSAILNLGYAVLALVANSSNVIRAEISYFYIIIYAASMLGFIAIIINNFTNRANYLKISHLSGLSNVKKLSSILIAIQMFSLVGIPPFAGFISKYIIFTSILKSGMYELIIMGIAAVVIGSYCYLNIVKVMYFLPATVRFQNSSINFELSLVSISSTVIVISLMIICMFFGEGLSVIV